MTLKRSFTSLIYRCCYSSLSTMTLDKNSPHNSRVPEGLHRASQASSGSTRDTPKRRGVVLMGSLLTQWWEKTALHQHSRELGAVGRFSQSVSLCRPTLASPCPFTATPWCSLKPIHDHCRTQTKDLQTMSSAKTDNYACYWTSQCRLWSQRAASLHSLLITTWASPKHYTRWTSRSSGLHFRCSWCPRRSLRLLWWSLTTVSLHTSLSQLTTPSLRRLAIHCSYSSLSSSFRWLKDLDRLLHSCTPRTSSSKALWDIFINSSSQLSNSSNNNNKGNTNNIPKTRAAVCPTSATCWLGSTETVSYLGTAAFGKSREVGEFAAEELGISKHKGLVKLVCRLQQEVEVACGMDLGQ